MKTQLHSHLNRTARENPAEAPTTHPTIYSAEHLKEHARALAQTLRLAAKPRVRRDLAARLADNQAVLEEANRAYTAQVQLRRPVPPAAAWLLDNMHIVREQIREIRQDLTRGFYAELPKLEGGDYAGYPRTYALALELLNHTDERFDFDVLVDYIAAYQEHAPLTLGELWSIPIMLRFGLLENLRRLIAQSLARLYARQEADRWADRFLQAVPSKSDLNIALSEMERLPEIDPEFAVQLVQRLRDQDPAVAPILQVLDERMTRDNTDLEQYLLLLNQRRTVNRVSVGNAITSMRALNAADWSAFVEALARVERLLEQDPAQVYAAMDFPTRDRYRHVVEKLSKRAKTPETDVAAHAVRLAREAQTDDDAASSPPTPADARRAHVGYYLIDAGRGKLEAAIHYRPAFGERINRRVMAHATLCYLGGIALLTLLLLVAALGYAAYFGAHAWQLVLTAVLVLIPASVFAVSVINWFVTVKIQPRRLPKLAFKRGIPAESRTMVVVPALLSSVEGAQYLLDHLEQRYLVNRDANLHLALLTDFGDAATEHRPEDARLLETVVNGIRALNEKYAAQPSDDADKTAAPRGDRFYLFHRERRFNDKADVWMGWERKRGKLIELNRLLRGATDTSYTTIIGDPSILQEIRYVITLDADTELPLNTARRLAGTMAHPLNRPVLDAEARRVTLGYGIIQPRADVTAAAAGQTRFSRIMTGDAGLDPYSSVSSDVYQDLFHTGVYIGKAIYDVDAMRATLGRRFPDQLLLSHDLLEGTYARTGLASDIVLLEDFPSGYDGWSQRLHRWTRGDWQITDWLWNRVPDASGARIPNPLLLIDRWKIFDNLRRSLVAPALTLLLAAGWTVLPGSPLVWTLIALGAMFFPLVRHILTSAGAHLTGEPWRDYLLALAHEVGITLRRAFVVLSAYLYQAEQNLQAIALALWRRAFQPRLLLQWTSAAAVERGQARTSRDYLQRMWLSPAVALVLVALVAWVRPNALFVALPILGLWIAAPWIVAWVSQPLVTTPQPLPAAANEALRKRARQMWQFYADLAGADDHWLPPDNYQTDPQRVVAHRTSPTNIGFLLLATVAALDFQFITLREMAERLERTLGTLRGMEQLNGHWYNWYDTLTLQPLLPRYVSTVDSGNLAAALIVAKQAALEAAETDPALAPRLTQLAACADELAHGMDFRFLYSRERDLFSIGYNVETGKRDENLYDLLASEARLASYIAIAQGQAPERHWFKLGRPLARLSGRIALLSWGGTMFEYLMPTLFMPDFSYTLLDQTYAAIIQRQIEYGREHRQPWGNSESGYYAFDFQMNYQYRMFGVPDTSLKREFTDTQVVAPYATFLALPYAPQQAWENLQALERAGAAGDASEYGLYEALDYTPARRPKGATVGIVREYMAHHQGMSLVALDNWLNDNAVRRRFRREPALAAIELLLQERVPQHAPVVQAPADDRPPSRPVNVRHAPDTRVYRTPHTAVPRAQLVSNGEYTVMVTNAGGGVSTWRELDVTRWRQDATTDHYGSFVYIRDLTRKRIWSATYQPTGVEPDDYRVTYNPDGIEFWREDDQIETTLELAVSPQANVEVRRLTLTNHGSKPRVLELTSYAEMALTPHRADLAHPAFQKLFVESEYVAEHNLLVFQRRPREPGTQPMWAFHLLSADDPGVATGEYETDRMRFLGRGGTVARPAALEGRLSNTAGAVLDPVMSLRGRVRLMPERPQSVTFVTGVTDSRAAALRLAEEYDDPRDADRTIELSRVHNQIVLQHLHVTPQEAQLYQQLASRVFFPEAAFRAPAALRARNTRGQSGLWTYGISGDYPIVLAEVHSTDELDLVRQLLLAHEYCRMHNFKVDLVILDQEPTSYAAGLRDAILGMVSTSLSHPHMDRPGGVFVRRAEHMPTEDRILLQTVARVILNGELGDLEHQLKLTVPRDRDVAPRPVLPLPPNEAKLPIGALVPLPAPLLENGPGAVAHDGRAYVITLPDGVWTPLPWSNVLANEKGGALVTESGLGYTWAVNSQQNKLTPWSNDPVSDASGQIIYVQDEQTGALCTPTPLPLREREPYRITHGAGYTRYEHTGHALTQTVVVFVPPDDPLMIARLTLRNNAPTRRHLVVTCYAEWALDTNRDAGQYSIVTAQDAETRALLARNTYNADFGQRVAVTALNQPLRGFTTDRAEFLGRNGATVQPRALVNRTRLSGAVGTSADPCAVLQTTLELAPGEEKEIIWLVGQGADAEDARRLVQYYRDPANVQAAFDKVTRFWDDLLGTVEVHTPDAGLNYLLNRQLLYQTLACRVWGRSAFYQSGGAYGFRDQLQDVMALMVAAPQIARAHILRAASRQFVEGDVQHWWHPPLGKGVRTRISDDVLWLPFVLEQYLTTTGDRAILDEQIPFLQAPLLGADQDEAYGEPDVTVETATLYEHCIRAVEHALRFGSHGLPLMGTGDWNDGMNAVGAGGAGESVWLGWFLYTNLLKVAPWCEQRGDAERAAKYRQQAADLSAALEEHAWDGAWYRRAYFDNGMPLGSAQNSECRIDAIAQAWGVISGAAPAERQDAALEAVEQYLVRQSDQMILLLTPPFEHSDPSPGYIQGYLPGIRENGGQYTHGVLWVVWAYLQRGDGDRAYELLHMLSPLEHTRTPEQVARYQTEPYVIAADVYSHPAHLGRGGWTWYTGSAGWYYRLAVEAMLGFQLRGKEFVVEPCIPHTWSTYALTYRDGATRYEITVDNSAGVTHGVRAVYLDDKECSDKRVPRLNDGKTHRVKAVMG